MYIYISLKRLTLIRKGVFFQRQEGHDRISALNMKMVVGEHSWIRKAQDRGSHLHQLERSMYCSEVIAQGLAYHDLQAKWPAVRNRTMMFPSC